VQGKKKTRKPFHSRKPEITQKHRKTFLFCIRQGPGTWFTAMTNSLDKHLEWIDWFVPDEIYFMGCSDLGILRANELCKQSRQTSGMNWLICSWWDLFYGLQQSWHLESIWTLQNSLDKHLDWSDWVFSFGPDENYLMGCSNLGILRAYEHMHNWFSKVETVP